MDRVITCDQCRSVIRPATEQRQSGDVFSVGFECPACKTWYHAYWHNDALEQERQSIEAMVPASRTNLTRAKIVRKRWKKYRKTFDRLQERMGVGAT